MRLYAREKPSYEKFALEAIIAPYISSVVTNNSINAQSIVKGLAQVQRPLLISGPCSAESEEQVVETAKQLAKLGVHILRAGIWKPRTRPNGFEGKGTIALDWMVKAREESGLPIATEVAKLPYVEGPEMRFDYTRVEVLCIYFSYLLFLVIFWEVPL